MEEQKNTGRELIQGAAFGLLLCALTLVLRLQHALLPESLTIIFLALLCISSPGVRSWSAVLTMTGAAILTLGGPELFGILRAAVFALVVFAWGSTAAPVFIVTALWSFTLLIPLVTPSLSVPPLDAKIITSICLEILGVTAMWFAAVGLSPWIGASQKNLTQRQYFSHLLLVPSISFAVLGFLFTAFYGDEGYIAAVEGLSLLERPVLLGLLGLLLGSMLLSIVLANVLLDYAQLFISAAVADKPLERSSFPEIDTALQLIHDQAQGFEELRAIMEEMRMGTALEPSDLTVAWRGFRKASEVLGKVPDAVFALSTSGRILVATPSVGKLLQLTKTSLVGLECSVLGRGASPWASEVAEWVRWALSHQEELLATGARRLWSAPFDGFYLEILIRAWLPRGGPQTESSAGSGIPSTIAFFLRRMPERRPLQANLLQPTEFERLGADNGEFVLSLADSAREIVEHVSLLTAQIQNITDVQGRPLAATQAGGDIAQLLIETDKVVRRMNTSVDRRRKRLSPSGEHIEEFELVQILENALQYVCEMLAVERRIRIDVNAEGEETKRGMQTMKLHMDRSEFYSVIQYLVSVVHAILPRARDLKFSIEHEQIGTSTASVITGSVPGRYVRLSLSHSGQSITSQVMAAQQEGTSVLQVSQPEPLSLSLFLLSRQIKRIGGFVSLQSSATKGTNIGLYLPADQRQVRLPSKRELRRMTGNFFAGASKQSQVLVVGQIGAELDQIGELLDRLSFEMITRTPQELLEELGSGLDFQGKGFGDGASGELDVESRPEQTKKLDVSPFRLIIFDSSNADFETLALIDELERGNPEHAKILLHEAGTEERFKALSHWVKLAKPVPDNVLQDKIRSIVAGSPRVQESLLVIEGSDPVGGKGFGD